MTTLTDVRDHVTKNIQSILKQIEEVDKELQDSDYSIEGIEMTKHEKGLLEVELRTLQEVKKKLDNGVSAWMNSSRSNLGRAMRKLL